MFVSVFVSVCVRTQELMRIATAPDIVLSRFFKHYEISVCCIMCMASNSVFVTAECRASDSSFRIAVCRESDFTHFEISPSPQLFPRFYLLGFDDGGGAMGWLRLVGS